jgi:uncharacterized protein YceH (UPF0502 family)
MTEPPLVQPRSDPRWRPLEAVDRRVLGVLVEKAKTTPDNYPLSLNALKSGCNQKSNRFPQMQLEDEAIEEALERLRLLGAVAFIQGGSRVEKYRHLAYEWLGVDKVELAVMAELLLRGAQTVGELRGRAARMEPIKGLDELSPILDHLAEKRLLIYLTPKGRGAVVSHALYLDRELDKVRREHGEYLADEADDDGGAAPSPPRAPAQMPATHSSPPSAVPSRAASSSDVEQELRRLQSFVDDLKTQLQETRSELETVTGQLRRELDELNRQLGN